MNEKELRDFVRAKVAELMPSTPPVKSYSEGPDELARLARARAYLPSTARLLTFTDAKTPVGGGERLMVRTATAVPIAANEPGGVGLSSDGWKHQYIPIVLYKTPNGRYFRRYYQGPTDDRINPLSMDEALEEYGRLRFHGLGMEAAFDSQFPDA